MLNFFHISRPILKSAIQKQLFNFTMCDMLYIAQDNGIIKVFLNLSECKSKFLQLISINIKWIVQWSTNKCQRRKWKYRNMQHLNDNPNTRCVLSLYMSQYLEKDLQSSVASNSG